MFFIRDGVTWSQQQKIQSSDIEVADNFGNSVNISSDGQYVIVGASAENSSGSVYMFNTERLHPNAINGVITDTTTDTTISLPNSANLLLKTAATAGTYTITLPTNLVGGHTINVIMDTVAIGMLVTFVPTVVGHTDGTVLGNGGHTTSIVIPRELINGMYHKDYNIYISNK